MHHIIWICIQNDVYVSDLWCSKRYFNHNHVGSDSNTLLQVHGAHHRSHYYYEKHFWLHDNMRDAEGVAGTHIGIGSPPLCRKLCINDFDKWIFMSNCNNCYAVYWVRCRPGAGHLGQAGISSARLCCAQNAFHARETLAWATRNSVVNGKVFRMYARTWAWWLAGDNFI